MTATATLLTIPNVPLPAGVTVDRLRVLVRRHEARLIEVGIVVKAGKHRLIRADRLEELRRELGLE